MKVQKDKIIKLDLTAEEVNTILAGLGELQAKFVLNLISKINQQCINQLKDEEVKDEHKES